MRHDLFMSGFGGQGVLLAGTLLAHAAIIEGKNVSFLPSYGVEKRGGAANCTVVIADGDVGSPVIGNPSVEVILNQVSMDKYAGKIKEGGICIINSSLVDPHEFDRDDVEIISLPMNSIAQRVGEPRMVNMVAVGAYAARTGVVSLGALAEALKLSLPERNHKYIPANVRVLEAGAAEILQGRPFIK